jgi:hypothetical protein
MPIFRVVLSWEVQSGDATLALTVRLRPYLERAPTQRSADRGVRKSVVVKEALVESLTRAPVSAYEAGKALFGRFGSGSGSGKLTTKRGARYAALVDGKQRRRR